MGKRPTQKAGFQYRRRMYGALGIPLVAYSPVRWRRLGTPPSLAHLGPRSHPLLRAECLIVGTSLAADRTSKQPVIIRILNWAEVPGAGQPGASAGGSKCALYMNSCC